MTDTYTHYKRFLTDIYLCRAMEGYKAEGWAASPGLDDQLAQLEAQVAEQFGDHEEDWGKTNKHLGLL